jgi:hypothetical protein
MYSFLEKIVEIFDFNLKFNLNYFDILNDQVGFLRFFDLYSRLYLKYNKRKLNFLFTSESIELGTKS